MGSSPWSRAAGAEAFQRLEPDEPRNMYLKRPEWVEAEMPEIALEVLTVVPEHSNDFYLDATVRDIVALLPADIAADADEIFVARVPDLVPNAEAFAAAEDARLAYVFVGVGTMLGFYAVILRRTVHLLMNLRDENLATLGEAMERARSGIPSLLAQADIQLILTRRRNWLSNVDLAPDLEAVLREWDERTASGIPTINELHDLGEHFVVAHEMAHHLLGHTHSTLFAYRSHPAIVRLEELRALTGVRIEEHAFNEYQVREFDADAVAFMTMAGEALEPGSWNAPRWYAAILGAMLALPALEDVALAAAGQPAQESGAVPLAHETHPPTSSRIQQIVDFIQAFPEPDSETAPHPIGLMFQVLLYREVLEMSRLAADELPG